MEKICGYLLFSIALLGEDFNIENKIMKIRE